MNPKESLVVTAPKMMYLYNQVDMGMGEDTDWKSTLFVIACHFDNLTNMLAYRLLSECPSLSDVDGPQY